MVTFFGSPSAMLRPLMSNAEDSISSLGYAEPNVILIASAVRSPMRRLYLRFT